MTVTFVRSSWVDSIITRLARTVSRTPITKTLDPVSNDETFVAGTPGNIKAAFMKRSTKWFFDKDGLIEGGDAYAIVKDDVPLNKNDILTVDGAQYRVQDVVTRYSDENNETALFKYANLFLTG